MAIRPASRTNSQKCLFIRQAGQVAFFTVFRYLSGQKYNDEDITSCFKGDRSSMSSFKIYCLSSFYEKELILIKKKLNFTFDSDFF